MPGLESKGAPALEGDYSDWAIYDSIDDTDLGTPPAHRAYAIFDTDEEEALFCHAVTFVKKYDVASKTLGSNLIPEGFACIGEAIFGGPYITSAYGKYAVILNYDYDKIYIFKDGNLVKTMTDAELGIAADSIKGCSFSPKGKYIVVVGTDKWVVLVGS